MFKIAFPFYYIKMNSQIFEQKYWCFECETSLSNLTPAWTCLKCNSSAVEQITATNDPRKHDIPLIQNNQEQEQEGATIDILTQVMRIGDSNLTITIINGPPEIMNPSNGGINIMRIISGLFSGAGNDQTPATPEQIEGLQKSQNVQCSVCQEDGGQGVKLGCGHCFHKDCILPWFQRKNTCPTCRKSLQVQ